MKGDMRKMLPKPEDILRIMESLALMMQNSAEVGDLDPSVYGEIAELFGYLSAITKALMTKDGVL